MYHIISIKNKTTILRVLLVASLFTVCASAIFAQNNDKREVVTSMQAGTAVIHAGTATVNLNKDILAKLGNAANAASYYVILTALDNAGMQAIVEKNDKTFVIHVNSDDQNPYNGASFDFVVFVKETLPAMMHAGQLPLRSEH